MITSVQYNAGTGHFFYVDGGRHEFTLAPEITIESPFFDPGKPVTEDNSTHRTTAADKPEGDPPLSRPAAPDLVQDLARAAWAAPRTSEGEASIDLARVVIRLGGQAITPQTAGLPADIQALADAFYGFDPNAQGKGRFHEQWELLQLEDTPDTVETKLVTKTVGSVEVIDGQAVLTRNTADVREDVLEEFPLVEGGVPVEVDGVAQMWHRKKIKKGKRVPTAKRARLLELQERPL